MHVADSVGARRAKPAQHFLPKGWLDSVPDCLATSFTPLRDTSFQRCFFDLCGTVFGDTRIVWCLSIKTHLELEHQVTVTESPLRTTKECVQFQHTVCAVAHTLPKNDSIQLSGT